MLKALLFIGLNLSGCYFVHVPFLSMLLLMLMNIPLSDHNENWHIKEFLGVPVQTVLFRVENILLSPLKGINRLRVVL